MGVIAPGQGHTIPMDHAKVDGVLAMGSGSGSQSSVPTFLDSWQSQLDSLTSQSTEASDHGDEQQLAGPSISLAEVRVNPSILQGASDTQLQSEEVTGTLNAPNTDSDPAGAGVPTRLGMVSALTNADERSAPSTPQKTEPAAVREIAKSSRSRRNDTAENVENPASQALTPSAITVPPALVEVVSPVPTPTVAQESIALISQSAADSAVVGSSEAGSAYSHRFDPIADQVRANLPGLATNTVALRPESSSSDALSVDTGLWNGDKGKAALAPAEHSSERAASAERVTSEVILGNAEPLTTQVAQAGANSTGSNRASIGQFSSSDGTHVSAQDASPSKDTGLQFPPSATQDGIIENQSAVGIGAASDSRRTTQAEEFQDSSDAQSLTIAESRVNTRDLSSSTRAPKRGDAQSSADSIGTIIGGHNQQVAPGSLTVASVSMPPSDESGKGIHLPENVGAGSVSTSVEQAFTALDAGTGTHSGGTNQVRTGHVQAAVGYQDPALGWVEVRGESSGGAVRAAVIPSSIEAAQALSAHMTGLHTYLAENRTPVETLTLSSFSGGGGQFLGQNSGNDSQYGSGQQPGHGQASEQARNTQSIAHAVPGNTSTATGATQMHVEARSVAQGRYISVVA
jgi:hypothetical protein